MMKLSDYEFGTEMEILSNGSVILTDGSTGHVVCLNRGEMNKLCRLYLGID